MGFEKNMGENSNPKNVNLDEDSNFIPKTIPEILKAVSLVSDCSKKQSEIDFHLQSYENEFRKVNPFKRDLPLCNHLLKDGIEKLTEERLLCKEREKTNTEEDELGKIPIDLSEKRAWKSSFQLWTTPVEYENQEWFSSMSDGEEQLGNGEGSFVAFKKVSTNSGVTINDDANGLQDTQPDDEKNVDLFALEPLPPQQKKQRRCWSPKLHELFVGAVDQIGGAEVATPKRILEKMKVRGLTGDEVKSHLQKYRTHLRKLANVSLARPANLPWLANNEVFDIDGDNNMQEVEVLESGNRGKQVDRCF